MDACRKHKARSVIAKLDRLSRNLAFIASLMESGVGFVAKAIKAAIETLVSDLAFELEQQASSRAAADDASHSLDRLRHRPTGRTKRFTDQCTDPPLPPLRPTLKRVTEWCDR